MPKQDGEITNILDIGAVTEECAVAGGHYKEGAVIIGVLLLDTHCCICKSNVQVMSGTLWQCNKCNMVQQMDRCNEQTYSKLVLEADGVVKTLSVFAPIIQEICRSGMVTMEGLLTADTFNLTYSGRTVITKITLKTELSNYLNWVSSCTAKLTKLRVQDVDFSHALLTIG